MLGLFLVLVLSQAFTHAMDILAHGGVVHEVPLPPSLFDFGSDDDVSDGDAILDTTPRAGRNRQSRPVYRDITAHFKPRRSKKVAPKVAQHDDDMSGPDE